MRSLLGSAERGGLPMIYETLGPEFNSLLIISGAGSAPLWAASTAWELLAQDLTASESMIQSTLTGMAVDWTGPASTAMQAALQQYVGWLGGAAAHAGVTGARMATLAGAYEQARNTSVPLAAVLANRTALMAAISTNILGINTAVIAALEAAYEMMWAVDVMAMKVYNAVADMLAAQQTPPAAPMAARGVAPTAGLDSFDPAGLGGQVGDGLTTLLTPLASPLNMVGDFLAPVNAAMLPFKDVPLLGPFAGLDLASAGGLSNASELANGPMRLMSTPVSMLTSLTRGGSSGMSGLGEMGAAGGSNSLLDAINELVTGKLTEMTSGLTNGLTNQLSSWGSQIGQQVSAQLASASKIGGLSVPEGAIQTITRALPIPPATTVSAVPTVQAGMPGGMFGQAMMGAMAGRGFGGLGAVAKAGAKAAVSAKGG